jgi:hypothetical protein
VLHHVEALVTVAHTCRPDDLQLALLRMVAATANGSAGILPDQLHVDRQLLSRWLGALASEGLLGAQAGGWALTEAGRGAVATGTYTRPGQERRTFYFVDQRDTNRPAHFLHLARPALPYAAPAADFSFDPDWLQECVRQPAEWKRRHQFPADVGAVAMTRPAAPAWREVILDRPEHLPVAVIRAGAGVTGFQAQPEDWKLRGDEPVFTLGEGWHEVFPELAQELAPELWRAAWQAWCRQRSLPPAETDGCPLYRRDYHLEVMAPKLLYERFKATRSDVLHGETWLLAGTGRSRAAACVKVLEAEG